MVKVFSQPGIVQANGFSPEWILKWVLRFPFSVKVFWHRGQRKGFSPVWYKDLYKSLRFAYVSPLMNFQSARTRIALSTDLTFVGFVTWMNKLMGLEVTLCDELLPTVSVTAHERPLARLKTSIKRWSYAYVCPQMSLQVSSLSKLLQALKEWTSQGPMLSFWPSGSLDTLKRLSIGYHLQKLTWPLTPLLSLQHPWDLAYKTLKF